MFENLYMKEVEKFKIKDFLKFIIVSLIFIKGLSVVFPSCIVKGNSMKLTLKNDEVVVLNRLSYILGKPKRGEIVVIEVEKDRKDKLAGKTIVKRVIGEGGDRLRIKDNRIYINNIEIEEEYLKEEMRTEDMDILIPLNEIFVMGDNRNESGDSREFGTFKIDRVQAKVMFKNTIKE